MRLSSGGEITVPDATQAAGRPAIVLLPVSIFLDRNALVGGCRRRLSWRGRGGWVGVGWLDQPSILLGLRVLVGQQLLECLPALLLNLLRDL